MTWVCRSGRVRPSRRACPSWRPSTRRVRPGRRDIREATVAIKVRDVTPTTTTATMANTPVRVLTDPVTFRGRQLFIQIVGDRTTEERTLQILVLVLVVGGAIALLVASGVGAAYANRALVPIRQSLMNQREALRRQREFAADASHELRTPLTVIRASVDDLERHPKRSVATVGNALTDIRDEVDHLTAMVDDLLLLARSDSGAVELERVPLDMGDIASTGASALTRLAEERAGQSGRRSGPGGDDRRPGQVAAARRDPRRQRDPPCAERQPGRRARPNRRRRCRRRGRGPGPGHPGRGPTAGLRQVLSRGRRARWRNGARAGDRGLDRGAARRPDRGREPGRRRSPLHGAPAAGRHPVWRQPTYRAYRTP